MGLPPLTRSQMFMEDALISFRRAYTRPEMRALAEAAGLAPFRLRRRPWFRAPLVATQRP